MIRRIKDYFDTPKTQLKGAERNRRKLLKYSGLVLGGAALTGCVERSAQPSVTAGYKNGQNSGSMEDRLAIRELIESYNAAVIDNDADAWADNWCADGVWNLGEESDIVGRETILKHWQEAMQVFDFVGMFAQPKFIRVGDQDARAEWHTNELCRKSDGSMLRIFGLYRDAYRRELTGWKIAERRYSILLMERPIFERNKVDDWR
ncbi:MAG: nuclear transport factor 2 family protein [Porticoccaceae bacterium]|nr:nuclear transport factor 2 family protein [Porticoccaceae bacterium]